MKQERKLIEITIMPGREPELTMYAGLCWDTVACPAQMIMAFDDEYPAFYFIRCKKDDEHSFTNKTGLMEFTITDPMYAPPALYKRLGWTKYMSYRMTTEPLENGVYVFDLKNAVPYAVDDEIEPEEMERLRKELTPMELTKLFMPGATEPYLF